MQVYSRRFFWGVLIILITVIFSYIFFERYLTEEVIDIKVINFERYGSFENKYFVFTPEEVFLNSDNYYHHKSNAAELMEQFRRGKTYKVRVVGWYIPSINFFRNIIEIVDDNPLEERHRF